MQVTVVDHPIVQARLTVMRDENSSNAEFRASLRELATLLVYEATRNLQRADRPIVTPVAPTTGTAIANPPLLVPVLRAGLGMAEAAFNLLPESQMGFVGIARDEQTHEPHPYMASLPESLSGRPVIVLDPMLATGGSAVAAINLLKQGGLRKIRYLGLIAAPEGVRLLREAHPDVPIYLAAVDSHLNEKNYIVPGLGDAGDRQFGTV